MSELVNEHRRVVMTVDWFAELLKVAETVERKETVEKMTQVRGLPACCSHFNSLQGGGVLECSR